VFGQEARTCVIEEHVGGRIYEVHADGREAEWGRIVAWEPPHRMVSSWHPGRTPDTAQELEVVFQAEESGTRVTLTHSGWEHLGERGADGRAGYDEGWDSVLQPYIKLAAEG
jgi:uncharacterized protein YndB with AHSA1/START domain